MSYAKQPSAMKKMQSESHDALDELMARKRLELRRTWGSARKALKNLIRDAYKRAAPSGRWNLMAFTMSGSERYLRPMIHGVMEQFRAVSAVQIRQALTRIRQESVLRHGWMLDQVTPDSVRVHLPRLAYYREAVRRMPAGAWEDRWALWVEGYQGALFNNLRMGAINESAVDDAEDEVDKTRVNTPAAGLEQAMLRLFEYQSVRSWSEGEDDITALNEDVMAEEIWKTRGVNVCDDCAANEGLTAEEADGDIPLHPNCYCFWLMVPKSYAKLLRSGDAEDRALASMMQAKGIVPESLVIRGADGGIAAKAIVDFSEWTSGALKLAGGL